MESGYKDATLQDVDAAVQDSWKAFEVYRHKNGAARADFLRAIARHLEALSGELLQNAHRETHLEESRLGAELKRTLYQLTSYADACAEGTWLDIRIDTADPTRNPPRPDLRKMLIPLGPVVVFGASNFPFAYSTVGGDTACALAAGCPVIIKAHPGHAETSELVAAAVHKAAEEQGMPRGVFHHLHDHSFEVGRALVLHPLVRAVGFTGSYEGGRALFDLAAKREYPIPIFAEMGSTNPVFLLPRKLESDKETIAAMYAASITQSVGQFCTNPGILVGVEGEDLDAFTELLGSKIEQTRPAKMLHPGIARNYHERRAEVLDQDGVVVVAETSFDYTEEESIPTVATTSAREFLSNHLLHQEVFGPYSLLIRCRGLDEMLEVARAMEGQLTATLVATPEEAKEAGELVAALHHICGRLVFNGVPTGVEVALAMHHGGPYPATTDSRFTAVGADGIKRFARPICYQGWSDDLLPPELRNENPLGLWRTVNNALTRERL
ncbi:MAG TPA: aldehyde dehydrogenase (NADP(+)) [Chitinophagaceae bacterium]